MAIAFRAVSSAAAVAGQTSLSPTLPTGTATGDGLLMVVRLDAVLTVNTPSGWTLIAQGAQATDGWSMAIFKRPSDGTAPSVTWNGTSQIAGWYMLAYTGTDATDPVDVASSQLLNDAFDTSWTPGGSATITTDVNGCLVISLGVNVNTILTNALGGWTEEIDANGYYAAEQSQASAGAFTRPTFTLASSGRENSLMLALKPLAGGPLVRTASDTLGTSDSATASGGLDPRIAMLARIAAGGEWWAPGAKEATFTINVLGTTGSVVYNNGRTCPFAAKVATADEALKNALRDTGKFTEG